MSRNAFPGLEREYDENKAYREQVEHERNQKPCTCPAYPFPHRQDSGKCRELYNASKVEPIEDFYSEYAIRGLFAPVNYTPIRNPL